MVVGYPHAPATGRRLARDGDVAAEVDQHAYRERRRHTCGCAVRGERLGGGAEVELDSLGNAHAPARVVDLERAPAWRGRDPDPHRRALAHLGEVAVVAGKSQQTADGGV